MVLSRFRVPAIAILASTAVFLFLHLIGVYIYEGGNAVGVPGGSVNIGLVGTAPEVPNPLLYGQNKQTDLILSFLFRGLLKYNDALGKYEGDIATCDIADLAKVTCEIREGGLWSDGTKIQTDDIIATLQAFKANPANEKIKSFLAGTSIVSTGERKIEIRAKEKSSLMLDLLTYPIVRSDMLERIRTDRLSKEGYITSGSYTFFEKEKNTEFGYDRITIAKSEKNPGIGWLDKYNFLFFPDASSLERGADNIGIIVPPPREEKLMLGPRFAPYEYTMYEYIGAFLNTDTTSSEIRKHIMLSLGSSIKGSVTPGEQELDSIFSKATSSGSLKISKNLADIMRAEGYVKPDERLSLLDKETGMLTGSSVVYEDNRFIELPSKKNIFFTEEADGEMLIAGKVPAGVSAVTVNDYTLKEFSPGNNRFSYKIDLQDETLKEGENTYTLKFTQANGNIETADTIKIYYSRDAAALKKYREDVEKTYLEKLNTPELVSARMKKVEDKKTALKALDPKYYYSEKGLPYTIRLYYVDEPKSLSTYAEKMNGALTTLSIKTEITPVSTKDLGTMIANGKKDYDMIIVGFEANGRFSRIGQIFLSTEAKNGINFSKIESKVLDGLFANLRIASTEEKRGEVETSIQDYLDKEAFFLPISSPIHTLYTDKNLKGIKKISPLQDITSLKEVMGTASIKEEYILSLSGKGIFGFFSWLGEKAKAAF